MWVDMSEVAQGSYFRIVTGVFTQPIRLQSNSNVFLFEVFRMVWERLKTLLQTRTAYYYFGSGGNAKVLSLLS